LNNTVEEKLYLGTSEQKRFNTTVRDNRLTDGGKVLSMMCLVDGHYPQEDPWISFLLEAEWTLGPWAQLEIFGQLKNPVTPSSIESVPLRLVA
jgi:hypothetical protein